MKLLLACLIALGLAACGTDGSMIRTGASRPSISPAQVVLYLTPPAHYDTVGLVSAKSGKHGNDDSKMQDAVQKLKEEAAEAGANGIIIQNTGEVTSGTSGVILSAGDIPTFFATTHHRETIQGTAIYVTAEVKPVQPDLSGDFDAVSAAAQAGDPAAQYNLGMLYSEGTGTPQNYQQALEWLLIAKASASPSSDTHSAAGAAAQDLEAKMTPEQVSQAQQRASDWFSQRRSKAPQAKQPAAGAAKAAAAAAVSPVSYATVVVGDTGDEARNLAIANKTCKALGKAARKGEVRDDGTIAYLCVDK